MAKKFGLSENMINSISKNVKKTELIDAKDNFKFNYIDIDKIIVNSKNFYPIVEIESLAEDISINGLNHNLVVRPIEDGLYEIISGERRYTALKTLVEKGESKHKIVPCKVIELNDIDSEIVLIQANAQTRELTDADKLKQIERLKALYEEKKAKGEKINDIRGLISKDIGLSTGQVAKYTSVSNNLIPELRAVLDEGNLTISNATDFAGLSEENQKVILDIINQKVDISRKEAVDIKKQLKVVEEEKKRILELDKQKSEELEVLRKENENKSNEVDLKIEEVKKEMSAKSEDEKKELQDKLKELDDKKRALEHENEELENSIINLEKNTNEEIENKVKQKVEEIKSKFEVDKLEKERLQAENKKLKEKLNENNSLNEDHLLNQELKIRLNNTKVEISKIAGLMAHNKIMDEDTLKLVKQLENELKFLNEQILLYNNQENFEK